MGLTMLSLVSSQDFYIRQRDLARGMIPVKLWKMLYNYLFITYFKQERRI